MMDDPPAIKTIGTLAEDKQYFRCTALFCTLTPNDCLTNRASWLAEPGEKRTRHLSCAPHLKCKQAVRMDSGLIPMQSLGDLAKSVLSQPPVNAGIKPKQPKSAPEEISIKPTEPREKQKPYESGHIAEKASDGLPFEKSVRTTKKSKILEFIRVNGPSTCRVLASIFHDSQNRMSVDLAQLKKSGELIAEGKPRIYSLAGQNSPAVQLLDPPANSQLVDASIDIPTPIKALIPSLANFPSDGTRGLAKMMVSDAEEAILLYAPHSTDQFIVHLAKILNTAKQLTEV